MGFEILLLKQIVTLVEVGNKASVRVMEKLGFRLHKTEVGEWRSFHHFVLEHST